MTCSRLARAGARTVLAAVLGSASASIIAGQTRSPAEPTAQISGTVTSAADNRPVARARVLAAGDQGEPHAAITGADGGYVLADLPPGAYRIAVSRTGYVPAKYGETRQTPATPVAASAGQQVTHIDIALATAHAIAGRILDEDGSPFAGAIVEALVPRVEGGADTLVALGSAETDDRGEFRVSGLPPGRYFLSASDPAFRSVSSAKGVLRYSPTYYPGVSFADQAKAVALGDADSPHVEFRLKLVPPARVSGVLAADDGRPLLNGAIVMSPREGDGAPAAAAGDPSLTPDGRFSFGHVVPGRYQIRARGQTDAAGPPLFGTFAVEVLGADVDGIRLSLRPGALLDGTLSVEARKGARPPLYSALRVRAPFTDGNRFGDAISGAVRPDGSFALRGLMTGAHQVVVDGLPAPWVVKRVLYRGSDITDRQIDVAEKDQLHDVRIALTDESSVVEGVVHDARNLPVADAGVIVFPRVPLFWMRTSRRMRVAYTDRAGRFTLPGLPAGEYLAVASMSVDETDLGRRDRLQRLEALGTPFRLESDDAQARVTLLLSPAGAGVR